MNRTEWESEVNNYLSLLGEDKIESKHLDFYWSNNWDAMSTASRIKTNLLGCVGAK